VASRTRIADDGKVLTRLSPAKQVRTKLTVSFSGGPPPPPTTPSSDPARWRPSVPVARVAVGTREFNVARGESETVKGKNAAEAVFSDVPVELEEEVR
jgi:hypothetical protein